MREAIQRYKIKWKEFFLDFKVFLKNILYLFHINFKEVFFFVIICATFMMSITSLLKEITYSLLMKVNNLEYIVPANIGTILSNPLSILIIVVLQIAVTFMALFEIAGLLHAFSMGQVGRETNIASMFASGVRTCRKALHPRNWLVIIFVVVLFPLTKVLPLSSSTLKLILPSFIYQTIDYTRSYTYLYNIAYFALLCITIIYIFAINIFVLQKSDFFKSCNRSRRLEKGYYLNTFLTMVLLTILLNFAINSFSSIVVINLREFLSVFQKSTGIVTKSAEIGSYTYVLRQILKSLLSPAVNNAALTVLFYRYIEEKHLMRALSKDVFIQIQPTKKTKIAAVATLICMAIITTIYLGSKFHFLEQPVDMPLVCAHRGDNTYAPENTMPAFELAASEGLSWIELDVHQTSDGVIICNHDSDLGRVTGTKISIHDNTYEELIKYEIGDWMPGNYKHVTVPKLEDVLKMAKENYMYVQVELKGHSDDVNFEENVLKVINDVGMHDDVMIISLNAKRVQRIHELDPSILKAYCMVIAIGDIGQIEYSDNVTIEESNVTPELVYRLHQQGKKVFCWSVDLEDTIQYLVSCGVDVIGTDNPNLVSTALDLVDYSGGIPRAFHILMNTIASMDK